MVLALPASAHITLENRQAEAGSYYKAVFRVGHGCVGSAVKGITIQIPPGVRNAKPMPKAGWQLDIIEAAAASEGGSSVVEKPASVGWRNGSLPDAWYDEFVLFVKLPDQSGKLYWKVAQICEQGRIDWADVPEDGKDLAGSRTPAAVLEVLPKTELSDHHH